MHYIIEGTDGTGKSTLAKHISNMTGIQVNHSSDKTKNDLEYHHMALKQEGGSIQDRFQIGELIYPILFGRKMQMTLMEAFMLSVGEDKTTIILYSSNEELIKNRLIERDGEIEDHVLIANRMFEFLGNTFYELQYDTGYKQTLIMIDIAIDDPIEKVEELIWLQRN